MLKERREAAQCVAARLFAVEAAIDMALTAAAELNAVLPTARTSANLSAIVGQEALDNSADTFASLVRARRQIIATHHSLETTRKQIGVRAEDIGGGSEKPRVMGLSVIDDNRVAA